MTRITVVGTGAMACLAGARLALGGAEVTVAGTWSDGLAAIAAGGIRLVDEAGETAVPVKTVPRSDLAGGAHLVLVLVKSYQTAAVAADTARAAFPRGVIVTLQNGLGNREVLTRFADAGQVAAGITSVGATLLGPGWVLAGGQGDTVIGPDSAAQGPRSAQLDEVAELLTAAGFAARSVGNVDPWLWGKLVVNAAINPLSAILGVPNGALLQPQARQVLVASAQEAVAVALRAGASLPYDAVAEALAVAGRTAGNRSSMLQDVSRGAPTEIDAISGEVLRRGSSLGVPTPVTAWLMAQVQKIEAGLAPETLSMAPLQDTRSADEAAPSHLS